MQLPDWTKAEAYAFLKKRHPACWAFEFLRRNASYQKAYEECCLIRSELQKRPGPRYLIRSSDPLGWVFVPRRLDGETIRQWMERVRDEGGTPVRVWYAEYYPSQFGLNSGLPDPSHPADKPPGFMPPLPFPTFPRFEAMEEFFVGSEPLSEGQTPYGQIPGVCTVVFDLSRPLTAQLKTANAFMGQRKRREISAGLYKAKGNKKPHMHASRLTLLLRILDATAADAKNAEIAAALIPYKPDGASGVYQATKDIDKKLIAARKFRDSDYRLIAHAKLASK